jgi:hypothetical protein
MPIGGPPQLPGTEFPQANPLVSKLFTTLNKPNTNNFLKRGSLVAFGYQRWIHDPYPLVLVTDVWPGVGMRGLNLHYLTFPYIRSLLQQGCPNPAFSYQNIKGDAYIVGAFRSYKWASIRQVKMLDCDFLLTVMGTVRSFDPNQVQAIRRSVQEQIQRLVNPPAAATEEEPVGGI